MFEKVVQFLSGAKIIKLKKRSRERDSYKKKLGSYPRDFAAHFAVVLADKLPSGSSSHISLLEEICGLCVTVNTTISLSRFVSSYIISPPGLQVKNAAPLFTQAAASPRRCTTSALYLAHNSEFLI